MENTKTCTLCGKTKNLSEFGRHRITKDQRTYWCLECNRKRAKAYRESPSGIYTNLQGVKKHRKGIVFEMTREEFIRWYSSQEKKCAYCDIPETRLEAIHDSVNSRSKRLTIDCVNINEGYKINNIVLACELCNIIKTNFFSFNEMHEIAQKYIKPKWQTFLLAEKVKEND